jgi:hypothetical protein
MTNANRGPNQRPTGYDSGCFATLCAVASQPDVVHSNIGMSFHSLSSSLLLSSIRLMFSLFDISFKGPWNTSNLLLLVRVGDAWYPCNWPKRSLRPIGFTGEVLCPLHPEWICDGGVTQSIQNIDTWPVITSIEPPIARRSTTVTFTGEKLLPSLIPLFLYLSLSLLFSLSLFLFPFSKRMNSRHFISSLGRNFVPGMSIWLQTPTYFGQFTEVTVQSSTTATAISPGITNATAERTITSVVVSVPDPTLTPPSRTYVLVGGFTVLGYVQDPPNILDDGYAFMFGPYLALTIVIIIVGSIAIIVGTIICIVQLRRYLQGKLGPKHKSHSYSNSD